MTWEPGESMWLCVGVVFGDHNTEFAPGDKRTASIGFDARTGRIYDADIKYSNGKKATGNGRSVLFLIWFSVTTEA